MRRIAKFLIRLYPANWRERYGEEFEALLEDSTPGWPGVFDLLKGALKMQLSVPAFPKLALLLSIAGLVAGLLTSFLFTPIYVSRAAMRYEEAFIDPTHPRGNRNLADYLLRNEQEVLSRTSLSSIIQDPRLDLYPEERRNTPLEDVIEGMRKDVKIRLNPPATGTNYLSFEVSFAYRDRLKAQQTVQALITHLVDANLTSQRLPANVKRQRSYDQVDRMEARIAALEKKLGMPPAPPEPLDQFLPVDAGLNLSVLDPPTLPIQAEAPDRLRFMETGFAAGLAMAIFIAIFRRKRPPIPFPAQLA